MSVEERNGERIVAGRYRLRRELGRGGMGAVWHAWDADLERDVAIKEVTLGSDLSEQERADAHARVRREARSAARLSHPAIIAIHDVLEHEGHPWIVMQLAEGRSLEKVLNEDGPLSPATVHSIATTLIDALNTAHQAGVVHRDVKPANVLYTTDGKPFLTDFGIANIEGETSITRTGALVGSPSYMAPEILEGHPASPATDLWSLGVTLYALLDGGSPFNRPTLPATLSAIVNGDIPPPTNAGPLTPTLMGLLTRDPSHRLDAATAATQLAQTPVHQTRSPSGGSTMAPPPAAAPGTSPVQPAHAPPPGPSTPPPPGPAVPPYGPTGSSPALSGPSGPTPRPDHVPPGPPAHYSTAGSAPRPWLLWTAASAVVVVVLVLVAATAWSVLYSADYDLYDEVGFAVEYPAGWEIDEQHDDDNDMYTDFEHPDDEIRMTIGVYTDPAEFDARTQLEAFVDGVSPDAQDEPEQVRLDEEPDTHHPADWDVAIGEVHYTLIPQEARAYDDPERFTVVRVIHVESDLYYFLSWNGAQQLRDEYEAEIQHSLETFNPPA
ncbi:serine/threonine-protein kinase [Lipingzhangella sp. LS1_29]|uniref:non-specific serine/threonine protein kinase n=1 Tax=Lipingzhangella rawalii TaxID=2055835 RepID=A0ABU2HBB4_9ACTN|nr:serine/threonine-protein kinase [Lipingzhangella rawalii]MDS1272139.1 serine/threonine-protein kinase [Lipingzhangella rawalii]